VKRTNRTAEPRLFRESSDGTIRVAVEVRVGRNVESVAIVDVKGAHDEATAIDAAREKVLYPNLGLERSRFAGVTVRVVASL
jgi:hypothetical protein